jgi:transposase InsO family protein
MSTVPAASTVHAVLRRHGLIDEAQAAAHRAFTRFEHAAPNDLWQMDFKGHFALRAGRCHRLTVLDDHSRYNLVLAACADERMETVRAQLQRAFERYGMPWRMTMDNGAPWGSVAAHELTALAIWLIRLGIGVSHSRPYHPQTQGKDERFHRTLKAEVLQGRTFADCAEAQCRFDHWRPVYNHERPHEALALQVPAQRYRPSARGFPAQLPPLEYGPGDIVRKVQADGWISVKGINLRLSPALRGQSVALRPTTTDGLYEVYFSHQKVSEVDLRITLQA